MGIVTVAAGVRPFAFLNQIDVEQQPIIVQLLMDVGLTARPYSIPFDLDIELQGLSIATTEAYIKVQRTKSPLHGLGVWTHSAAVGCNGIMSLGSALSYPRCCEMMDLLTKQKDHEVLLAAIVKEEGDDPSRVERALLENREYSVPSYDHCQKWNDRFVQTHALFPFVLHTACDDCLGADQKIKAKPLSSTTNMRASRLQSQKSYT